MSTFFQIFLEKFEKFFIDSGFLLDAVYLAGRNLPKSLRIYGYYRLFDYYQFKCWGMENRAYFGMADTSNERLCRL